MTTEAAPQQAPAPEKASSKISPYGWYALTLVSAAQAMSLLDRQILSILANDIREDLGIGNAEIGLLYGTVFALFYALFSLPLGRLVGLSPSASRMELGGLASMTSRRWPAVVARSRRWYRLAGSPFQSGKPAWWPAIR